MGKPIEYYFIQILSLSIYSLLFLFLGFVFALIANSLQPSLYHNEEDRKKEIIRDSKFKIVLDIIVTLVLIVIGFFIIRLIIAEIPYPFEGYYGFHVKKMDELHGVIFFAPVFFLMQPKLVEKMQYLRDHIFHKKL